MSKDLSEHVKSRLQRGVSRIMELAAITLLPQQRVKHKQFAELDFWVNEWDAQLRSGRFWNDDVKVLLQEAGEWQGHESDARDYETIRWMEARAHGLRILKEVKITDRRFFEDKIVVDIGPGAVCFLEASRARLGVAVEPLAQEFAAHHLLIAAPHVIYLPVAAEAIPLLGDFADIIVSRNNLDHVEHPRRVVEEVYRILRPSGYFVLIVHLEGHSSVTEPHAIGLHDVRDLVRRFTLVQEVISTGGRTQSGQQWAGICQKLAARDVGNG